MDYIFPCTQLQKFAKFTKIPYQYTEPYIVFILFSCSCLDAFYSYMQPVYCVIPPIANKLETSTDIMYKIYHLNKTTWTRLLVSSTWFCCGGSTSFKVLFVWRAHILGAVCLTGRDSRNENFWKTEYRFLTFNILTTLRFALNRPQKLKSFCEKKKLVAV